jgi:hypothetical protein
VQILLHARHTAADVIHVLLLLLPVLPKHSISWPLRLLLLLQLLLVPVLLEEIIAALLLLLLLLLP